MSSRTGWRPSMGAAMICLAFASSAAAAPPDVGLDSTEWRNYGGDYQPFRARLRGGRVWLSGMLHQKGETGIGQITVLPESMRPLKRVVLNAHMHTGTARVDVLPNGSVQVVKINGTPTWISLEGLSFFPAVRVYRAAAGCEGGGQETAEAQCKTTKCGPIGGHRTCAGACRRGSAVTCDNAFVRVED